ATTDCAPTPPSATAWPRVTARRSGGSCTGACASVAPRGSRSRGDGPTGGTAATATMRPRATLAEHELRRHGRDARPTIPLPLAGGSAMSTRPATLILATLLGVATPAHATTPGQQCAASKIKAAGKKAACLLYLDAKVAGGATADPIKMQRCEDKL